MIESIVIYGLAAAVLGYALFWLFGVWALSSSGMRHLRSGQSYNEILSREDAENARWREILRPVVEKAVREAVADELQRLRISHT